jgi:hypothetical protein
MIPEIEEFAKTLVQWVRDASIQSSDMILRPTVTARIAERWRTAANDADPAAFARILIPDIVDDTIFHLLHAIDEGLLKLSYTASNGKVVDLMELGHSELAGEYIGTEGWRGMYSKERFVDDFADIKWDDSSTGLY